MQHQSGGAGDRPRTGAAASPEPPLPATHRRGPPSLPYYAQEETECSWACFVATIILILYFAIVAPNRQH
ncbi:hypothetical protein NGA_0697200 [Nannochloropsis gaditana CCMP526]|uniref:uncharacterized protein n=1 Tax=Nannochloropsis gaditana (strain CCMP526) TaxID=1093141 RepID=UPI00029F5A63|nr:hypothetical protein NGA_0697200 [Nannochloropsis gaditana CCMP526]EKU23165.1 hypothetical protein NGA_0697200 [Nannochloropsis gaditana CCMP526]|eukprot:XP_005852666.1 hypothetical protein NGA_0697200 [Nannochloropsis gaditana CCMP526]